MVTTHQHGDHWQALADVVAATRARTYAGRDDAEGVPVPTDVLVDDGDIIRVGRVELTARHLVGHTPGSIALVYDDPHGHPHVFTGDCLFPGGVGNTRKDPKAFASLIHDVETKIFNALPDRPGSTRDTATTPPSAPSDRICRSRARIRLVSIGGAIDAVRAADIIVGRSLNYTPYIIAGLVFVALTIPMTRFTDWVTARMDRRRAQGGTL
ncbi:Hydroxyacylglutathione hydrolase [Streptomyces alboniger]